MNLFTWNWVLHVSNLSIVFDFFFSSFVCFDQIQSIFKFNHKILFDLFKGLHLVFWFIRYFKLAIKFPFFCRMEIISTVALRTSLYCSTFCFQFIRGLRFSLSSNIWTSSSMCIKVGHDFFFCMPLERHFVFGCTQLSVKQPKQLLEQTLSSMHRVWKSKFVLFLNIYLNEFWCFSEK